MSIMTFAGKDRFAGRQRVQSMLKLSWEAEIFGVGMMEALAEMYPEHIETLTACANMEWFNTRYCEGFGHSAGMHVTVERAEKLGRLGAATSRGLRTFERVAKLMVLETPVACLLYKRLGKVSGPPELKTLADDLYEHENAMTDWFKSELDGRSDGGEKVFAYLQRHGITREEAVTPRKLKDLGGDRQELVLVAFASKDAADQAAIALKKAKKAGEDMNLDAISVLVKDKNGKLKERKSGGGPVRTLFQKGLKVTDEEVADIGRKFEAGLGVLVWDFQAEVVASKLERLGGIPQSRSR
jgi:hypothetical protein